MLIPGFLLRHEVTVEPYEGDSAYGPVYTAPVAVRCFLDEQTRVTKNLHGREVVSNCTFYARPNTVCPAESRVTLPDGAVGFVIKTLRRDGGGLATPDHLEVQL